VDTIIGSLVRSIHAQWKGGTQDDFAELAVEQLRANDTARQLSELDLLEAIACASLLEQIQAENEYGQPTITLCRDSLLRIEIIQWNQHSIKAHQHASAGAFAPIRGRRLSVSHDFERGASLGDGIWLSKLTPRVFEVLDLGHVEAVRAGEAFTHELFLLSPRCTTLVVRLREAQQGVRPLGFVGRQFAFDEQDNRMLNARRRVQTLQNIRESGSDRFGATLVRAVSCVETLDALHILSELFDGSPASLDATEQLARRLAVPPELLLREVQEAVRRRAVSDALQFCNDLEDRLVLSALWAARTQRELRRVWSVLRGQTSGLAPLDDLLVALLGTEFSMEAEPVLPPLQMRLTDGLERDVRAAWRGSGSRATVQPMSPIYPLFAEPTRSA
jgi:hypothetical protein